MGDQITGVCIHPMGSPPAPPVPSPLPFSAPLLQGLEATVMVGGKPVAVMGSSGYCTPPHVGIYPGDPFLVPPMQVGRVVVGSTTVLAGGKPMASMQSTVTMCLMPGSLIATGATVLIG
jgi:uncharacterized Zn-binding protein involved in type VI secretion